MPTRRIDEPPHPVTCYDPEHSPPSHRVFQPGLYEHECPSCGKTTIFRVIGDRLARFEWRPSPGFEWTPGQKKWVMK